MTLEKSFTRSIKIKKNIKIKKEGETLTLRINMFSLFLLSNLKKTTFMGVSLIFSGEAINQDRLRDFREEFYEKYKD